MTEELYKRYRPSSFQSVLGQDDAVRCLIDMGKRKAVPHCLLFVGPSGVGKTTLARILRKKLGCGDSDFRELNAADFRGIDMVRDIRGNMSLAPISGRCRVWIVDECHQLTSDAQNGFLKLLEDTPKHVYFMLSTTDPQKLKKTIITRSTEIKLVPLARKHLDELVSSVSESEDVALSEDVRDKLVDQADGSARKVLVLLHAIIGLETEEEQLEAIAKGDHKAKAIELARALLNPRSQWSDVAKILKGVEEEPEQLRYMVLGYCRSVLLGGGKMAGRAALIMERFEGNFYDGKSASLVLACYDVVVGEK